MRFKFELSAETNVRLFFWRVVKGEIKAVRLGSFPLEIGL